MAKSVALLSVQFMLARVDCKALKASAEDSLKLSHALSSGQVRRAWIRSLPSLLLLPERQAVAIDVSVVWKTCSTAS